MMQKGFGVVYILVGVLILAVVAGGAYYLSRSIFPKSSPNPVITSQTPQPTPTLSPDQTANWKTYTNPNFKFLIKYPLDWQVSQVKESAEIFIVGFGQIGIKDYKGDPFSIVDLVVKADSESKITNLEKIPETVGMEEFMGSFKVDKYVDWSDITINGIKAKRADHLYCQSGSCHNILFKKDNKVYGITMNQGGEDLLKIFSQMLSTFKFTN